MHSNMHFHSQSLPGYVLNSAGQQVPSLSGQHTIRHPPSTTGIMKQLTNSYSYQHSRPHPYRSSSNVYSSSATFMQPVSSTMQQNNPIQSNQYPSVHENHSRHLLRRQTSVQAGLNFATDIQPQVPALGHQNSQASIHQYPVQTNVQQTNVAQSQFEYQNYTTVNSNRRTAHSDYTPQPTSTSTLQIIESMLHHEQTSYRSYSSTTMRLPLNIQSYEQTTEQIHAHSPYRNSRQVSSTCNQNQHPILGPVELDHLCNVQQSGQSAPIGDGIFSKNPQWLINKLQGNETLQRKLCLHLDQMTNDEIFSKNQHLFLNILQNEETLKRLCYHLDELARRVRMAKMTQNAFNLPRSTNGTVSFSARPPQVHLYATSAGNSTPCATSISSSLQPTPVANQSMDSQMQSLSNYHNKLAPYPNLLQHLLGPGAHSQTSENSSTTTRISGKEQNSLRCSMPPPLQPQTQSLVEKQWKRSNTGTKPPKQHQSQKPKSQEEHPEIQAATLQVQADIEEIVPASPAPCIIDWSGSLRGSIFSDVFPPTPCPAGNVKDQDNESLSGCENDTSMCEEMQNTEATLKHQRGSESENDIMDNGLFIELELEADTPPDAFEVEKDGVNSNGSDHVSCETNLEISSPFVETAQCPPPTTTEVAEASVPRMIVSNSNVEYTGCKDSINDGVDHVNCETSLELSSPSVETVHCPPPFTIEAAEASIPITKVPNVERTKCTVSIKDEVDKTVDQCPSPSHQLSDYSDDDLLLRPITESDSGIEESDYIYRQCFLIRSTGPMSKKVANELPNGKKALASVVTTYLHISDDRLVTWVKRGKWLLLPVATLAKHLLCSTNRLEDLLARFDNCSFIEATTEEITLLEYESRDELVDDPAQSLYVHDKKFKLISGSIIEENYPLICYLISDQIRKNKLKGYETLKILIGEKLLSLPSIKRKNTHYVPILPLNRLLLKEIRHKQLLKCAREMHVDIFQMKEVERKEFRRILNSDAIGRFLIAKDDLCRLYDRLTGLSGTQDHVQGGC